MNVGMLWLDDDKRLTIDEKVKRAADYYQNKYGRSPDMCLVNKAMLAEEMRVDNIQVRPVRYVLPNHFWVGVAAP